MNASDQRSRHFPPRLGLVVAAIALFTSGTVLAQQTYQLEAERKPRSANRIKPAVATFALPYDKTYEELSAAEREGVRAAYEDLPATDDPPFPKRGLRAVYQGVIGLQKELLLEGRLVALLNVDAQGLVASVSFIAIPSSTLDLSDSQLQTVIGRTLLEAEFKPGTCGGTPCAMEFPVQMSFEWRNR